jgi:ABC-type phosphate transport system substrate-binding protein
MTRHAGLLLSLVVLLVATSAQPMDAAIVVIVNPRRSATLRVEDVARIFLRKQRFWDDGSPIVPLNREAGSTLRETFSHRVLGVTSTALAAYWNEQYFLGTMPPATLSSSEAVKRYVATERNAIGYIDANAVDESVRVVLELDVTSVD